MVNNPEKDQPSAVHHRSPARCQPGSDTCPKLSDQDNKSGNSLTSCYKARSGRGRAEVHIRGAEAGSLHPIGTLAERPHFMNTVPQEDFAGLAARVAADRDREAFARLFDHFAPRINGYLQRLGLEAGLAEDIAQEVMSVLWHKAHLFDPAKSSLATWLFRIARNRRIDGLRRDRSHLLDPYDPALLPEETEPADQGYAAQRRDERVRVAMKTLSADQLELLQFAYYLGLTHSQIAERTGLPLGTVKSRIRLAFGKLRKILDADPAVDTD